MITHDNLLETLSLLNGRAKTRILSSDKKYCVLYLHIFNTGACTTCTLTNNFNKYRKVSDEGHAVLPTDEVINLLKELENE